MHRSNGQGRRERRHKGTAAPLRVEEHGPPGQETAGETLGHWRTHQPAGRGLGGRPDWVSAPSKGGSGQCDSTASEPGATKRVGVAEPRFTVYIKLSPDRTAQGHLLVTAAKRKETGTPCHLSPSREYGRASKHSRAATQLFPRPILKLVALLSFSGCFRIRDESTAVAPSLSRFRYCST